MKKYAIGVDFGTESGRALIVDIRDGSEIEEHVMPYPHGVITETLPESNVKLEPDSAYQHPQDYIDVLQQTVASAVKKSRISSDEIVGIGIDFTTCTMLPVDRQLNPLCLQAEYKHNPHSWVKLWKHHAAQAEADHINALAKQTGQPFLPRYGGKISSEWMLAKVYETLNKAPRIYEAADQFVEAADWVVAQMTGQFVRNSCTAGFKAMWHKREGYPGKAFLNQLDPRLADLTETKLRGSVVSLGAKAGYLSSDFAKAMGLAPGIPVAVPLGDAHAGMVGTGAVTPGKLLMAMGTSTCHMLLSDKEMLVEGICGVVEDGIVPGLFGYEAGQSAVGDIFAWFVSRCVPGYVEQSAKERGWSMHQWLEQEAARLKPGQSGLIALDWWNGNRSTLMNADLSGLIIGLTLQTKPEELYRALLEATAFGTRTIIEAFEKGGIPVDELYACGGLPQKNKLLMQIYADVANRDIKIAASTQTAALGAAIYGTVAAGPEGGGYASVEEAAANMAHVQEETIKPNAEHVKLYDRLYQEYLQLYDYFGRGSHDMMQRLKAWRGSV